MRDRIINYLFILKLELNDLYDDIQMLMDECQKEKEKYRITDYVFMENLSLFKNEVLGVNVFHNIIDSVDPHDFDNLDELIGYLKERFRTKAADCGIEKAIDLSISRKMDKVKKYVTQ